MDRPRTHPRTAGFLLLCLASFAAAIPGCGSPSRIEEKMLIGLAAVRPLGISGSRTLLPPSKEPPSLPSTLTCEEAVRLALAHSPALTAGRYLLDAAQTGVLTAGRRPDPYLELSAENFGGSRDFAGTEVVETTLSLSQTFELGGKRRARLEVAAAEADVARLELQEMERRVEAEARLAYLEAWAAQMRLDRLRRGLEASNRSPSSQVRRSSEMEIDIVRAESDFLLSRLALARTWGGSTPGFRLASRPKTPEIIPPIQDLLANLSRNPTLQRRWAEVRLRGAEVALAGSQAVPDLTLGFGGRRFAEADESALVASVGISLPVFSRDRGEIRRARASQAAAEAIARQEEHELRIQVFAEHRRLQNARRLERSLGSEPGELSPSPLRKASLGSPLSPTLVDRTPRGAEGERTSEKLEAEIERHRALIELRRLVDFGISGSTNSIHRHFPESQNG